MPVWRACTRSSYAPTAASPIAVLQTLTPLRGVRCGLPASAVQPLFFWAKARRRRRRTPFHVQLCAIDAWIVSDAVGRSCASALPTRNIRSTACPTPDSQRGRTRILERPGSLQMSQVQVLIVFLSPFRILQPAAPGSRSTYMLVGLRRSLASRTGGSAFAAGRCCAGPG